MVRNIVIAAIGLALVVPAGAAIAHDENDDSFSAYFDHALHQDYHQQEAFAHEEAHERGFSSPQEHDAWHRAAAEAHGQYHNDNPETWHDHYAYSQPYYGDSSYAYRQPYGGYGYRQSYRYYRPRHHVYRYYSYPYGY